MGERRDGMHYFCKTSRPKALKVGKESSLEVWHKRLRHPSLKAISMIFGTNFDSNNKSDKHCEVCQ